MAANDEWDDDDNDDDIWVTGVYENGHWIWDEGNNDLAYVTDVPAEVAEAKLTGPPIIPTGIIKFSDDVDLLDQIRYRKRFQRKLLPGEPDIVTLQDVKDIALFTAPFNILSPNLINMLHIPTTERFLRALILYCGYFLQVYENMASRSAEIASKIRTPSVDSFEITCKENLSDLRLLVAKEYSIMVLGVSDLTKYHHKGLTKKKMSLTHKDARLYNSLLRISVQIVWLALGRRGFHEIELEVNRLLKTENYNDVEHSMKTGFFENMTEIERPLLLGHCGHSVKHSRKSSYVRSPLINELNCSRKFPYAMLGFGIIEFDGLTQRDKYMEVALVGPEETFLEHGVSLGILGMPRHCFDTMLQPIVVLTSRGKHRSSSLTRGTTSTLDATTPSTTKDIGDADALTGRWCPEVILPPRVFPQKEYCPMEFPRGEVKPRPCSDMQRRRWQTRLHRLLHPRGNNMPTRSRDRSMYDKQRSYTKCQRA